ncbi:hypothetical protein GCM10010840_27980 [Deinococcus aerolatus]|uniref:Uncharacterized protein n=1 Tax=Deinococcus aerolatus TaxID=522487 RepID=A0ABQ2GEI7_9DEIO|nr:hypothetical protein GCM10010840_27980 [Deinococcus aerolatus]
MSFKSRRKLGVVAKDIHDLRQAGKHHRDAREVAQGSQTREDHGHLSGLAPPNVMKFIQDDEICLLLREDFAERIEFPVAVASKGDWGPQ